MPKQPDTAAVTNATPAGDAVVVTLSVPAEYGCCQSAQLVGDFTAWAPVVLRGEPAGGFSLTVRLPRGRSWQYRFLVDGYRWINDPSADEYVCRDDGARHPCFTHRPGQRRGGAQPVARSRPRA